ncbi:HNH endonuclease signature motif containing protein [Arsenicicoccus sp. oral taxon 190]|uniref:HNH endonuclease signature motif containing protein n=1 Tax=Arsenicicoccus sp. oral taxon 190 TaxID=1658671 RepID=UPI00067D25DA|nr:HNH endonuclease signature motif containing protein [Arsenicicoccus sp. oral taxon 190]
MNFVEVDDARQALSGLVATLGTLTTGVVHVQSGDLGELAAQAGAALALARGLVTACAAEAKSRGVLWDSGSATTAHWLCDHDTGLTRKDANAIRRALEDTAEPALAELRSGLLDGSVTPADASLAARLRAELCGATDPAFHDDIARGVAHLARQDDAYQQLHAFRVSMLARYGTTSDDQRCRDHQEARRGLSTFSRTSDGLWSFHGLLGDADKVALHAAITAFCAPRSSTDEATGEVVRDERTAGQRRLDALLTLTQRAADTGATGPMGATCRASLVLPMDALRLPCPHRAKDAFGLWRGISGEPCDCPLPTASTDDLGTVLSPVVARELTCSAEVTPVWVDHLGQPLDVGRSTRLATLRQRRALQVRDQGCSFPRCSAPASWTQAHHIVHWADGGPTDVANLALLCTQHHRFVHHQGITGRVSSDGSRVVWDVVRAPGGWRPAPPDPGGPPDRPDGDHPHGDHPDGDRPPDPPPPCRTAHPAPDHALTA